MGMVIIVNGPDKDLSPLNIDKSLNAHKIYFMTSKLHNYNKEDSQN